ncbi:hypothetical protein VTH06DRAFT_5260 [Thermothelomyces fergusii]
MNALLSWTESPISQQLPGLAGYFLGIVLLVDIIHRVWRWHRLRHVPGPVLAGWTSLWLGMRYLKGTYLQDVSALADKYGPVVRIAPNKVFCSDVETLHRIGGARSEYRKSEWYTIARISRHADNVFTLTDPALHKARRKQIMPGYSGKDTAQFEEGIDRALAAWIDLIDRKYLSTPEKVVYMNLEEKSHFYTLDAMGEIAWSDPLGFLKHDRDVKNVLAFKNATVRLLVLIGDYVAFWRTIRKWPFYYLLPNDGSEVGFGAFAGSASKILAKRSRPDAGRKRDMLQSFIDHGLGKEELVQEVAFQFVAGADTTSSLFNVAIYLLLTHPAAYARLQAELDAAAPAPAPAPAADASASAAPFLSDAQARALPYLQAVVRETLRLFPPLAGAQLYKEVPPGGDAMCGRALPGGTLVATGGTPWHIGRDRAFWGADADCFRPERWLEEAERAETAGAGAGSERLAQMVRRVEMVFGCGRFVCAGRAVAHAEAGKVIGELVRRYNWSLANPLDPPSIYINGVWMVRNFWVKVEKR